MDLKEIINRPITESIDQDESCFVIKQYLRIRKNINVNPIPESRLGRNKFISEISLMSEMTNHAIVWFKENTYKS